MAYPLFTVRVCPVCGKTFFPAPEHQYHLPGTKYSRPVPVCSYTCQRTIEKEAETRGSREKLRK